MSNIDSYVMKCLCEANIDYDKTLARFCGNTDLLLRLLVKFPQDSSHSVAINALKAKDYDEMQTGIHTLKGVSGNLGITGVFNVCTQILAELAASNNETAANMMDTLATEYVNAVTAINKLTKYLGI